MGSWSRRPCVTCWKHPVLAILEPSRAFLRSLLTSVGVVIRLSGNGQLAALVTQTFADDQVDEDTFEACPPPF